MSNIDNAKGVTALCLDQPSALNYFVNITCHTGQLNLGGGGGGGVELES